MQLIGKLLLQALFFIYDLSFLIIHTQLFLDFIGANSSRLNQSSFVIFHNLVSLLIPLLKNEQQVSLLIYLFFCSTYI